MIATQSKGSILLADDEATFVMSLAELLRLEGYHCVTVPDGLAAAAELNSHPTYDLLIADIRMPGNPDLELIRHLPQIAEGLPVILVTAYPDAQSALGSAQLPVLSYLIKPIKLPELLPLVRKGIAHSALYRANQAVAKHVRSWGEDVQTVNKLLSRGTPGLGIAPDVFLNLWLRNLLACLSDLDDLCRKLSANDSSIESNDLSDAIAAAMRAFEASAGAFHQ